MRDTLRTVDRRHTVIDMHPRERGQMLGQPYFYFTHADGAPFTQADTLNLIGCSGDDSWVLEEHDNLVICTPNLIVADGKEFGAKRLLNDGAGTDAQPNKLTHVGVGDSDVAEQDTDSALQGTSTRFNAGTAAIAVNVATLEATFPADSSTAAANFDWFESGLANVASNPSGAGEVLFNRKTFGQISKSSVLEIVHGYDITLG